MPTSRRSNRGKGGRPVIPHRWQATCPEGTFCRPQWSRVHCPKGGGSWGGRGTDGVDKKPRRELVDCDRACTKIPKSLPHPAHQSVTPWNKADRGGATNCSKHGPQRYAPPPIREVRGGELATVWAHSGQAPSMDPKPLCDLAPEPRQ